MLLATIGRELQYLVKAAKLLRWCPLSSLRSRPMSVELFPTGRDPLRRLGSMSLITGLLGLLAIVYVMVKYVQDRDSAPEWMLGVGTCLLFGAVAASLVHGVLLDHRARIEALEKLAAADANRPADGTPS
jgi:hypothetical protein